MRTHIDWLTFTITPEYFDSESVNLLQAVYGALDTRLGSELALSVFGGTWVIRERSRAPYTKAWEIEDAGITLFASENLTHACVETSGSGCERLIDQNTMTGLLTVFQDRVTRIDIASDIETNVKPTEFVSKTNHERMRSSGYQTSESGETCYVGSQKSDRYARVYRYFEPHPRAHLLRVECVFRREYAKKVASACLISRASSIAQSAGMAFGFNHDVWRPDDLETADISVVQAERKMGKTIYWLIKSCAPAFKRLCEDGTIKNPEQFLQDYFVSDQKE